MTVRRKAAHNPLRYLSDEVVAGITTERANVEHRLSHEVCGRYLGNRDGHPNVCWEPRGHPGGHL